MRGIFHIREIREFEGLSRLREDWEKLVASSSANCVYLTFDWIDEWLRHYGSDLDLRIVVAFQGTKVVGIGPFCLIQRRLFQALKVRSLEFVGSFGCGAEYLDIIVAREHEDAVSDEILGYIVDRVGKEWDVVWTKRVLAMSAFRRAAARLDGARLREIRLRENACAYVDLESSWERQLRKLSKNFRKQIKKNRRALSLEGEVRFSVCDKAEALDEYVGEVVRLHRKRWEAAGQRGSFRSERYVKFHQNIAKRMFKRGKTFVGLLVLNGRAVGAKYGFIHEGTYYAQQGGWDPEHQALSVGLAAQAFSVEECIRRGLKRYDFLSGEEAIKWRWTGSSRQSQNVAFVRGVRYWFVLSAYRLAYVSLRSLGRQVVGREWRERLGRMFRLVVGEYEG
jgi:CelD/BcsL family acetyltransferase involved in cellulose biosynthesis